MTVRFRLHPLNALFLWRRYVLLLAIPLLRGIGTGGRGFFLRLQELWIYVLLLALILWVADRSRQTNTLCTTGCFYNIYNVFHEFLVAVNILNLLLHCKNIFSRCNGS